VSSDEASPHAAATVVTRSPGRLAGSTVLITGGSSGIGKQLALDMARQGARVAIVALDERRLHEAEAELRGVTAEVFAVPGDVTRQDDVDRLAVAVRERLGEVDVLVNNAGFAVYRTFEETDIEELCRLADVNLIGAIRCTRAFLPGMVARRRGHIVNMSSLAGRIPITPNAVYGASKHGLVALSDALRYELHDMNVRVHVICPGRVETPFFDHETFRTRTPRAETRYTVTVEQISRATLRAIETGRFMTYVPWTLGVVAWSVNALPWLTRPLLGRLMVARVRSYYGDRRRDREPHP
jgi:uncharacterized protein